MCAPCWRRARDMRPARSLHDLVARLDHRRRRYHRVRRLWGTGLGVLGGGLLLLGGLGDPPRVPACLDPCRGAPGGRGASRARRGRWRTRDRQRATGGASAPPGVRRPAAPRLRHATALAGAVSVRDGPCGGVPHPALARASACPHAAGAGPGRAGARRAGEAGGARQPHAPHAARAGDPSCPARGRGVLRDLVLSRGPCRTPPATGAGPPDRGPEAPRAAAGGPPAARAACPPPGARRDLWPAEPWGA